MKHRRINLPEEYDRRTGHSVGGDTRCHHDFPLGSMAVKDDKISWTCSRCQMQRIYKKAIQNDVFKTGFALPRKVYIVGSGPNGKKVYEKIDNENNYLLALNQAVMIHDMAFNAWMCMDITCPKKTWWRLAYEIHGKQDNPPTTIFGEMLAADYPADYTFKNGRAMNHNDYEPIPNVLRPGCTVAGQALQLCYHLGVKQVYLVGIDMFGNKYYDGGESRVHQDGEPWNCINRMSGLIKFCKDKGMKIRSLSRTALMGV